MRHSAARCHGSNHHNTATVGSKTDSPSRCVLVPYSNPLTDSLGNMARHTYKAVTFPKHAIQRNGRLFGIVEINCCSHLLWQGTKQILRYAHCIFCHHTIIPFLSSYRLPLSLASNNSPPTEIKAGRLCVLLFYRESAQERVSPCTAPHT